MHDAKELLGTLVAAVCSPDGSYEEAMSAAQAFLSGLDAAEDLDALLRGVAPAIEADDVERAGIGAIIAGSLVERGADPAIVARALTARLQRVAETAERYLDACRQHFQQHILGDDAGCKVCAPGEDEKEVMMPQVRQAVSERMPEGEAAWIALDLFSRPAVSMLTRLPELRRELAAVEGLVFRCGILAQHQAGPYFVFAILSVLDGERVVVLDPAQRLGFECVLTGIADNFQLHLLLADALIGGNYFEGERPSEEIVAAMRGDGPRRVDDYISGYWNLFQWTGLRPDGTLPDGYFDTGTDHWVWNEGVPADIAEFEGTRVILLAPTPYIRSWQPSRLFEALPARFELERVLDEGELDDWMRRLQAASAELRGEPQQGQSR